MLRRRFRFSEGQVPHDADDMLHEVGKPQEALLYSLLFVPELCAVDGSVLLLNGSGNRQRQFLEAKAKDQMPLDRLEASFNSVEIPFLFLDQDFGDGEEMLIAEKIAEAWRRALVTLYPDRRLVVNIVPAQDNAGNITVECFESRTDLK